MPDAGGQAGIARGAAGASILADRYRVRLDEALPELDVPGATAFAASDLQGGARSLFARVLEPGVIPRVDMLVPLRANREVQMLRPVEWGAVEQPGKGRRAFAIVFERPAGGPLAPVGATAFAPIPVAELTGRVLAPAALALAQLARRGLTHGAIRPDNMFAGGPESRQAMVGECVTSPPGFSQPAAFVTIEQGMTPTLGRGLGTSDDDMYALGVTVLALSLGRMPLAGLSPAEVVQAKLARGSFIALLGGERVPFGLREVLRGLLSDDARERWGLAQIEQWLGGGINKAMHDASEKRMDRPVTFRGKEYWGFREIAHAFGKDWRAASSALLDEGFAKWMARGLDDADLAEDLKKTLKAARIEAASNPGPDPKLVAQICTLLDPDGPIRYRGVVAMPTGLGPLLASAVRANARDQVSDICDVLAKGIAIDWLTWRAEHKNSELAAALKPYKELQQLLRHSGPGYGVERCLYELNPHLPCQSPAVEPYYVETLGELLPTLETVVARTGRLTTVFDRHFAAFIANRAKRNLDREFAAMEATRGDQLFGKLGMVKLFAWLQSEYGPPSVPRLTAWLAADLDAAVDRFGSKSIRTEVRRRLAAAAPLGDLKEIYEALCDRSLLTRDDQGRRAATQEFMAARRRISLLEARDPTAGADIAGGRFAAWLSGAAALISAALVVLT